MAKPEIIGYQHNPVKSLYAKRSSEFTMTHDDITGEPVIVNAHGREIRGMGAIDQFMKEAGWDRIYREREFKATLYNDLEGCSMRCRKCGYRWSTVRLPHDSARLHETGYCSALQGRGAIPRIVADE